MPVIFVSHRLGKYRVHSDYYCWPKIRKHVFVDLFYVYLWGFSKVYRFQWYGPSSVLPLTSKSKIADYCVRVLLFVTELMFRSSKCLQNHELNGSQTKCFKGMVFDWLILQKIFYKPTWLYTCIEGTEHFW